MKEQKELLTVESREIDWSQGSKWHGLRALWWMPGEFKETQRTFNGILKREEKFHLEYLLPTARELNDLKSLLGRGAQRIWKGIARFGS